MELSQAEQKILNVLLDLKSDVSEVKTNMKSINSSVINNANNIEKNRESIVRNDIIVSKWIGGLCVIVFITNFFAYYLVNNKLII